MELPDEPDRPRPEPTGRALLPRRRAPPRVPRRSGVRAPRTRGLDRIGDDGPRRETLGLSTLPDGRLLREAIAEDPIAWLGRSTSAVGVTTRACSSSCSTRERLPVHAHPHDDFAAGHLGRAHGKAEAWYILEGGTVHVGLREDVTADALADLVARQDVAALLGLLHAIEVGPGDVVWVPPGSCTRSARVFSCSNCSSPRTSRSCSSGRDSRSTAPGRASGSRVRAGPDGGEPHRT